MSKIFKIGPVEGRDDPVEGRDDPVEGRDDPVEGRDDAVSAEADRAAWTPLAGAAGRRLAVERLRQAILAGDMAPGQRLVEEELAGMLGVTRASLRAALFDLTADGLVERIPNRGARVRVITLDEAVAITECRTALEGLCAAKAAERITGPEAARLQQLGAELQRSVADGEPLKYSALNHELHRLVREISGQTVAAALLERLNGSWSGTSSSCRCALGARRPPWASTWP